ncbi:hypothetical protein DXG01_015295 [Tephrocybe rancida]|nr:hypothetical protein DXG01_015295 [Tephrocybe rancida]
MSLLRCRRRTIASAFDALKTRHNSISALQAAFRDPSSPFHIPPGSQGPASPDPPAENDVTEGPLKEATRRLTEAGFDPTSFWEQRIVWADQDPFRRIKWMISFGHELGGKPKADAMMRGQGVSLILKSIAVRFRRPVTYPDTLLIGYRPQKPSPDAKQDLAEFHVAASAYSLSQKAIVATSDEALVWYDYDRLRKCVPSEETRASALALRPLAGPNVYLSTHPSSPERYNLEVPADGWHPQPNAK